MKFPNARAAAILLFVSLALAACGGDDDTSAASSPSDGGGSSEELLDISVPLVGGGDYQLGQHKNSDLVLWFWAPW